MTTFSQSNGDISEYADPDFGVLVPRALILEAFNLSPHKIRVYMPLLEENVDFIRQPGQGAIERIFFTASGVVKLAQLIPGEGVEFLNKLKKTTNHKEKSASLGPVDDSSVEDNLSPYAPASALRSARLVSSLTEQTQTDHGEEPPNPAQIIAERLASYILPTLSSRINQSPDMDRVVRALNRLESRPKELLQAESALEQQQTNFEQFLAAQRAVLEMQQGGVDNSLKMMNGVPRPEKIFLPGEKDRSSFQDLIDLFNSTGMQILTGGVCFVAVACIVLLSKKEPAPQPVYVPQQTYPSQGVPLAPPVQPLSTP
jgi:hypothetical protein